MNHHKVVDNKAKGDPSGMLFTNEVSQGNPMLHQDNDKMAYYARINAAMVKANPIKAFCGKK